MSPFKETDEMVPVFYVVDFDRCLGRTEKFHELLEKAITQEHVIDPQMIRYAHDEVKKTGGSFDTAAYVRQVLKDQGLDVNRIWGRIEASFIVAARKEDVLEPYARELLGYLSTHRIPHGILTYGGFEWQTAKLKAAGLTSIPYVITSYKEKGRIIASWLQVDGHFLIPAELAGSKELVTKKVVLIDDKPVSFNGLPSQAEGICVSPLLTEGSTADLPPNVIVRRDMSEALSGIMD